MSQALAVVALVIVSSVVNVFELTMKRVSAASRSRVASTKSVASTLDTKRKVRSRALKCLRASYAMTGPRSEPPIPMFTTLRMRSPVAPRPRTGADTLGEVRHPIQHRVHLRDDIDPVDDELRAPGIRNAT